MIEETKKEKLLNLADDIESAERIIMYKDLDDRFPDSATLNQELKDLIVESLRKCAKE